MSKFYTYDHWHNKYQPLVNPIMLEKYPNNPYYTFETYGEDIEYVKQQDEHNIWTEVDGDEGCYILPGMHWANRINYYITVRPWEDDSIEVPTWCFRDCDCRTEENDWEYDPNCTECEEGTIDIPCDTVEDLKQIYGEDAPIDTPDHDGTGTD